MRCMTFFTIYILTFGEATVNKLLVQRYDILYHINDTFGHFEGDNAISKAVRAILANKSHICARFGGDEFVVAAPVPEGTEKEYFLKFKNGFLKKLSEYNSSSGKAYQIGSRIGIFAEKLTADFDI